MRAELRLTLPARGLNRLDGLALESLYPYGLFTMRRRLPPVEILALPVAAPFGPGGPLESAGWRLVPHLYIPRSWHWPVDFGLVAEFAFENPAFDADAKSVTILPILEKRLGRIQIDLNPTFGRSWLGSWTGRPSGFRTHEEIHAEPRILRRVGAAAGV